MAMDIRLPADLESLTYRRFDDMVRTRQIFFEPTEPVLYDDAGFQFDFRIVEALKQKPILAADDPGRKKAGGPFVNPKPEEILTCVGTTHRLMLNKYSFYRPMLVSLCKIRPRRAMWQHRTWRLAVLSYGADGVL
jgi:sulfate adenylyltransferase (ADP) / ATP adenylyltransferase